MAPIISTSHGASDYHINVRLALGDYKLFTVYSLLIISAALHELCLWQNFELCFHWVVLANCQALLCEGLL